MIKLTGNRWNESELELAKDDLTVMASMPKFVFGYVKEFVDVKKNISYRVVTFFDVEGNKEKPIRGQEIIDDWKVGMK